MKRLRRVSKEFHGTEQVAAKSDRENRKPDFGPLPRSSDGCHMLLLLLLLLAEVSSRDAGVYRRFACVLKSLYGTVFPVCTQSYMERVTSMNQLSTYSVNAFTMLTCVRVHALVNFTRCQPVNSCSSVGRRGWRPSSQATACAQFLRRTHRSLRNYEAIEHLSVSC
jgi:hypothetical protein